MFTPVRAPMLRRLEREVVVKFYEDLAKYKRTINGVAGIKCPPLRDMIERRILVAICKFEIADKPSADEVSDEKLEEYLTRFRGDVEDHGITPSLAGMEAAARKEVKFDPTIADHGARALMFLASWDEFLTRHGWSKYYEDTHEKRAVRLLVRLLQPVQWREFVIDVVEKEDVKTVSKLRDLLIREGRTLAGMALRVSGAARTQSGRDARRGDRPSLSVSTSSVREGSRHASSFSRGDRPRSFRGPAASDRPRGTSSFAHRGHFRSDAARNHSAASGSMGRRTFSSAPFNSSGTQRRGPPSGVSCWHCGRNHLVRDCPIASTSDKDRHARERMSMTRSRQSGPLTSSSSGSRAATSRSSSLRMMRSVAAKKPSVAVIHEEEDGHLELPDGQSASVCLDTGATVSMMSQQVARRLGLATRANPRSAVDIEVLKRPEVFNTAVSDEPVIITGKIKTPAIFVSRFGRLNLGVVEFHILPNAAQDILLSRAEMARHGMDVQGMISAVFAAAAEEPELFEQELAAAGREMDDDATADQETDAVWDDEIQTFSDDEDALIDALEEDFSDEDDTVPWDEFDDEDVPEEACGADHLLSRHHDDSDIDSVDGRITPTDCESFESSDVRSRSRRDESSPHTDSAFSPMENFDSSDLASYTAHEQDRSEARDEGPAAGIEEDDDRRDRSEISSGSSPSRSPSRIRGRRVAARKGLPDVDEGSEEAWEPRLDDEGFVVAQAPVEPFEEMLDDEIQVGTTEEEELRTAIEAMFQEARENGLSEDDEAEFRRLFEDTRDTWCLRLDSSEPADVEPLRVHIEPGVKLPSPRVPRMSDERRQFLKLKIESLERAGLVYHNVHAVTASPVLVVPRPGKGAETPLERRYRMVVDMREVNKVTTPVVSHMPQLDAEMTALNGMKFFGSIDLQNGYWQMPLHEESQEFHSIMTPEGVYTPTRVVQGCCDGTQAFQSRMREVLKDLVGKTCLVWLDDILVFGRTAEEHIKNLREVVRRLQSRRLKINAAKTSLFKKEIRWCGKLISGQGIRHDPERVSGLANAPRPQNAGELLQFLAAVNWMRTSIPDYAKTTAPLYDMKEDAMKGFQRRTKRAASKAVFKEEDWTEERKRSFTSICTALQNAATLAHPDEKKTFHLFTDASKTAWSAVLTQTPPEEDELPVETRSHEPLMFLSGRFRHSQLNWSVLEKEGYAIIHPCKRMDYLLQRHRGFTIHTDHRNLKFLLDPSSSAITQRTVDKVERWRLALTSLRFKVEFIEGKNNHWADLLSRWGAPPPQDMEEVVPIPPPRRPEPQAVPIPPPRRQEGIPNLTEIIKGAAGHVRVTTRAQKVRMEMSDIDSESSEDESSTESSRELEKKAPGEPKPPEESAAAGAGAEPSSSRREPEKTSEVPEMMSSLKKTQAVEWEDIGPPSYEAILQAQNAFMKEGGVPDVEVDLPQAAGSKTKTDGLLRDENNLIWIPDRKNLRQRLMVVAHQGAVGHRGFNVTLKTLLKTVVWHGIKQDLKQFLSHCLHCLVTRPGERIPRPFAETTHATKTNQVIHFDYLFMEQEKGNRLSGAGSGPYKYVLVVKDDYSGFVRLYKSKTADAKHVVECLKDWFSTFGIVKVWVSDRGSHFLNKTIKKLSETYRVNHHFVTAYAPWANGTVERVNSEVLKTMIALMSEWDVQIADWPELLPVVQAALNALSSRRLGGASPFEVMFGRPPSNVVKDAIFSTNAKAVKKLSTVDLNGEVFTTHIQELAASLEAIHKKVVTNRTSLRSKDRRRGVQEINFTVGDYVLVASVAKRRSKLEARWTGPFRVSKTINDLVFEVTSIVDGATKTVHAERMKLYADADLGVTKSLKEFAARSDARYVIERIVKAKWEEPGDDSSELLFQVVWKGFSVEEASWVRASTLIEDSRASIEAFSKRQYRTDPMRKAVKEFLA